MLPAAYPFLTQPTGIDIPSGNDTCFSNGSIMAISF